MKRIDLELRIKNILLENVCTECSTDKAVKAIVKFIGNNYRRRVYRESGYMCNTCYEFHRVGAICDKPIK